ncbi:MAG: gamma-glutamyltransferase [Chromatiales bacterium]|nr:gamma-glutamyltransferase [Chromatiales bacterium]
MQVRGAIAAGHDATARAGERILASGGNAFDAALAAMCAACVAEPVLCSLGGGGFLLARSGSRERVFDFFAQTPRTRAPDPTDFYPITADFGTATQEFHIGLGSVATPGIVRGLFEAHRALGALPMREIVAPAIEIAREGVVLNPLQAYIFSIVAPIYLATDSARAIFASPDAADRTFIAGECMRQPALADTLELLAIEGERLFYEGEIGRLLTDACASQGGHLRRDDLERYRLVEREPLQHSHRGTRLLTNPLPAAGGTLIALALGLIEDVPRRGRFGEDTELALLAHAMERTQLARHWLEQTGSEKSTLAALRERLRQHAPATRGTTHISVIDGDGNAASITLTNGEGCGWVIPGTGIMPNNMLGEADLNPLGFGRWRTDVRLASMMAPSLLVSRERIVALGSGGSNRLRSAVLQVILNLLDHGLPPDAAVAAPRLHVEDGLLSLEPGFTPDAIAPLLARFERHHQWNDLNLFFGGVHTVAFDGREFSGAGDPRRGGVFRLAAGNA